MIRPPNAVIRTGRVLLLVWACACAEGATSKTEKPDTTPPAGGMGGGSSGAGGVVSSGTGGSGGTMPIIEDDAGVDEDAGTVVDAATADAGVDAGPDAATPTEKRKALSIDGAQVPSVLMKFPLLVRITDAELGAGAQEDGLDIRFEDGAGTSLPFEREAYDSATGALTAWVQVGLNGSDQVIYLIYGSGDMTDMSDPVAVWDSDHTGVWHLEAAGTAVDSTSGGHDAVSSTATSIAGVVGNAANFNGSQTVALPGAALGGVSTQVTASLWAFGNVAALPGPGTTTFTSKGTNVRVIHAHIPWSDNNIYWDAGDGAGTCCLAGQSRINKAATAAEFEGQWNHYAFTKDSGANSMKIYLNGALWHSGAGSQAMVGTGAESLSIGSNSYTGWIDEFRVSKVERSAAWITVAYNNQRPASTLITVGAEEDL